MLTSNCLESDISKFGVCHPKHFCVKSSVMYLLRGNNIMSTYQWWFAIGGFLEAQELLPRAHVPERRIRLFC